MRKPNIDSIRVFETLKGDIQVVPGCAKEILLIGVPFRRACNFELAFGCSNTY
jgi:hypothetical protein